MIKKLCHLVKLRRQEWWGTENLEKLRDKKLRFIIQHAYNNSRFYHSFYKNYKKEVRNFRKFKDMQKLPVLEKEHVQKYSAEILGEDLDYSRLRKSWGGILSNYMVRMTSGSSGQPVFVAYDSRAWDFAEAVYARSLFGSGYNALDLLMVSYPYNPPKRKWFDYLGIMRKKYIQISLSAAEQLQFLLKNKNRFSFFSFPSILLVIAAEAENHKEQPRVNRIVSSGECLSESIRKKVEAAFGCKVYDHYGSAEINRIAWECDMREGMHINIDSVAVEFVRNDVHAAEGETGEIIATSLCNYAFPLIRYRLGDFGMLSEHKCSCGRGLPLMEKIKGRRSNFIMRMDGTLVPMAVTITTLGNISGILQFRLVQSRNKRLTLYLVKKEGFEGDVKTDAMQQLLKLDSDAKVRIIFVNNIKRDEGGKLNPVVSRCIKNT